jgi:hypothetical protein
LKARQIADLGQHRHCRNEIVTSGLNFTQNHRFEFATGVAAGAVE